MQDANANRGIEAQAFLGGYLVCLFTCKQEAVNFTIKFSQVFVKRGPAEGITVKFFLRQKGPGSFQRHFDFEL